MITTFWLVIMISIAGGRWQPMVDEKYPDIKSCEAAAHEHWAHMESGHLKEILETGEEFEIGVSCQQHHSKSDPA